MWIIAHLGFPLSAAWCIALNPLLLVIMMSAWWSSKRESISSRFLEMASCNGVSPSESCNIAQHSNNIGAVHKYQNIILNICNPKYMCLSKILSFRMLHMYTKNLWPEGQENWLPEVSFMDGPIVIIIHIICKKDHLLTTHTITQQDTIL